VKDTEGRCNPRVRRGAGEGRFEVAWGNLARAQGKKKNQKRNNQTSGEKKNVEAQGEGSRRRMAHATEAPVKTRVRKDGEPCQGVRKTIRNGRGSIRRCKTFGRSNRTGGKGKLNKTKGTGKAEKNGDACRTRKQSLSKG